MRFFTYLLVLFLFLNISVCCSKEYTDSPSYTWMNFTDKDGLVFNGILKFAFDPEGYVWIATGDDANPKSGGISVMTPYGDFMSYTIKDGLPDNRINDILVTPIEKSETSNPATGGLWAATGYGVAELNRKGKWTIYDKANSNLPDNRVSTLILDNSGNIWAGTFGGGVAVISKDWKIYDRSNGLAGNQVATGFKDQEGNLWFGIWDGGISKFDGKNFKNYSMGNSGLISNAVTSIRQNPIDSKMWFATSEGISVFDGEEWTTYRAEKDKFLISNFVSSLAFEPNGTLWIGYWGEGVTVLKPDGSYTNIRKDNSELLDNYVGTVAIDKSGNKWLGTYKGFSVILAENTQIISAEPSFFDYFSLPGREGVNRDKEEMFNSSSYHWELAPGEKLKTVNLKFAVPVNHYGKVKWSYGAFFAEGTNLRRESISYSIARDMLGNEWGEFGGAFREADFIAYGYVSEYLAPRIKANESYPFPEKIPEDVERFLIPGTYMPSDNPDIYKLAQSLVKESSKGDMYLTVKDIAYSNLFRDMSYDYSININENGSDNKLNTKNPKADLSIDILQILKKNAGVSIGKARLFCSLCKAAGIPARLVSGNGLNVWSEVWINRLGWLPVETGLPACDYGGTNRVSIPKNFDTERITISGISGNDDDVKSIEWYPEVKASYKYTDPKEVKKPGEFNQARLLIIKPAEINQLTSIPLETLIPVGEGLYMFVEKMADKGIKEKVLVTALTADEKINYMVIICDKNKNILEKLELKETGRTMGIEKKGLLTFEFIPRSVGEYLVMEIMKWDVKETIAPHKTDIRRHRNTDDGIM